MKTMILLINLLLMTSVTNPVIFDFNKSSKLNKWQVVNDGVMGGKSQATFGLTDEGTALFKGEISLENNGGFSSVRYDMDKTELNDFSRIAVKLKGDGKRYQLRIRENQGDYFSYIAYFQTSGEWETIEVSMETMYPSFRGRKLNRPDFNGNTIVELTFLIGNKKQESFALELDKIWLK